MPVKSKLGAHCPTHDLPGLRLRSSSVSSYAHVGVASVRQRTRWPWHLEYRMTRCWARYVGLLLQKRRLETWNVVPLSASTHRRGPCAGRTVQAGRCPDLIASAPGAAHRRRPLLLTILHEGTYRDFAL